MRTRLESSRGPARPKNDGNVNDQSTRRIPATFHRSPALEYLVGESFQRRRRREDVLQGLPTWERVLSEPVVSAGRMRTILTVTLWLVLGLALWLVPLPEMTGVMAIAFSADQADRDTVISICDIPGCRCTAGRITCSCTSDQEVIVSSLIPPITSIIEIERCPRVTIERNAIFSVKALTRIVLNEIKMLRMEENAFNWEDSRFQEIFVKQGLHIYITKSYLLKLPAYAFKGRIDSLIFDETTFEKIESYAFTSMTGTEKIEFKNCILKNVDTQAFKKITLDRLTFSGGSFLTPVQSKTMLDIDIKTEFKMDGMIMNKIHSSAFKISHVKQFYLKNNIINDTLGEAFSITALGPVFILNNHFKNLRTGAFNGLKVDDLTLSQYDQQELIFENNTVTNYEPDALIFNTSSFEPQLDRIKLDLPCTCTNTEKMMNDLIVFSTNYPYQKTRPRSKVEEYLWCQNAKDKDRYKMVKEYRQKTSCFAISTGVPTYLFTIALIFIPLLGILLLYCFWFRKKKLKWLNVSTESPTKNTDPSHKSGKHNSGIIMPEGKTYRETELHVIIEKAEPIAEYVSEEPPLRKDRPLLTSDL